MQTDADHVYTRGCARRSWLVFGGSNIFLVLFGDHCDYLIKPPTDQHEIQATIILRQLLLGHGPLFWVP